jgi:hypothetical protein
VFLFSFQTSATSGQYIGKGVVLMSILELIALLGLIVTIVSAIVKNNDKKK